jgi:hypothetical protein
VCGGFAAIGKAPLEHLHVFQYRRLYLRRVGPNWWMWETFSGIPDPRGREFRAVKATVDLTRQRAVRMYSTYNVAEKRYAVDEDTRFLSPGSAVSWYRGGNRRGTLDTAELPENWFLVFSRGGFLSHFERCGQVGMMKDHPRQRSLISTRRKLPDESVDA